MQSTEPTDNPLATLPFAQNGALSEGTPENRPLPAPREVDTASAEVAVRMLLEAIGADLTRDDLRETPARVARFWREFMEWKAGNVETFFPEPKVAGQMVTVSQIQVWSVCAHHMLPFHTNVAIGYIAKEGVVGLSKLPRIALAVAHGLQTQEFIAQEIADEVERVTHARDVIVTCKGGVHTCASMRGIRTPCSMNNMVVRGDFGRAEVRADFYFLTAE